MIVQRHLSVSLILVALWTAFCSAFSPTPSTTTANSATATASSTTTSRDTLGLPRPLVQPFVYSNMAGSVARGGGATSPSSLRNSKSPVSTDSKCPVTGAAAIFGSLWGTGGVIYILTKAIKRVIPIAMEPFQEGSMPLTQLQLGYVNSIVHCYEKTEQHVQSEREYEYDGHCYRDAFLSHNHFYSRSAYIVTCLWFAYVEGYKGFQKKFSPLVVKRSFTLVPGKNNTQWYHFLLAPIYSMGMIHATRKRKIVSWSVTIGVAAIVALVKRFPYPWRNIVDAGVVAGLTWYVALKLSLSIVFY